MDAVMVKDGLFKKVVFEQNLKKGRVIQVAVYRKNVPDRGNSKCKSVSQESARDIWGTR